MRCRNLEKIFIAAKIGFLENNVYFKVLNRGLNGNSAGKSGVFENNCCFFILMRFFHFFTFYF